MAILISREELDTGELLETEVRRVGAHAMVILAGEIDVSTAGRLYEQLAGLAGDVCVTFLSTWPRSHSWTQPGYRF